ncbi:MAG: hypothetical protein ACLVHV_01915 [Oscillospiraceae bacterium]
MKPAPDAYDYNGFAIDLKQQRHNDGPRRWLSYGGNGSPGWPAWILETGVTCLSLDGKPQRYHHWSGHVLRPHQLQLANFSCGPQFNMYRIKEMGHIIMDTETASELEQIRWVRHPEILGMFIPFVAVIGNWVSAGSTTRAGNLYYLQACRKNFSDMCIGCEAQ